MGKYKVLDIAKYFMNKELFFSNKKLQKMVFYAYVWFLVKNNNSSKDIKTKLFNSRIEAWVHGPVCPELYFAYNDNIIKNYKEVEIDKETQELLELIIKVYGDYSGDQLEMFTHMEEPWQKAREGCASYDRCTNVISDVDIYEYYSKQID